MDENNFVEQDEDLIVPAILLDDEEIDIEIDVSEIEIYEKTEHIEIKNDNVIPLQRTRIEDVTQEDSNISVNKNQLYRLKDFYRKVTFVALGFLKKFKWDELTKKQKLFRVTVAFLTALTIFGLILESPLFNVDNVELNNSSITELTQNEIEEIEGIIESRVGEPIYRANKSKARSALEDIPSLKNISIEKDWPSTLIINFERRTPTSYIVTDKGIVLVDSEGFVFEKAKEQPQDLIAFEGIEEINMFEDLENENFQNIIEATPQEIKNQIVQIKLLEDGTYNAVLGDGIVLKIGKPNELDRKLAIAWSIILAKDRSELGYIDVSVPNLPVSGPPELQV